MGSKHGEAGSLQRPRRFGANQRIRTGKIADLKLKTNEVPNCSRASVGVTSTVTLSVGTDHNAVTPSRAWQKACSNTEIFKQAPLFLSSVLLTQHCFCKQLESTLFCRTHNRT